MKSNASLQEWQPRQAEDALRLYYFHYLGKAKPAPNASVLKNVQAALAEVSRLIRLKHYSYSTERTYLQWWRVFFAYVMETSKKRVDGVTAKDIRNFLSHLALSRHVSASTQNQTFNAILFLFRNVLHKDVDSLDATVRAKRGVKLLVALTMDKVKRLFEQMT